jgi:diaminopimelate decarboxylase
LRVNPDLEDANTHQKTFTAKADTKFGIDITEVVSFAKQFGQHPFLRVSGLHFHLGSPIYDPTLYAKAIEKALQLIENLAIHGLKIDTLDIGGGFCSVYGEEQLPPIQAFSEVAVSLLRPFVERGGRIILEPGRSIAATAGILLSEVLYTKQGRMADFAVLDAGMSHLIRPALYDAFHFMWPVRPSGGLLPVNWSSEPGVEGLKNYDLVGPICETGDLFARNRLVPELRRGDRIAIFSCGAYGMTMASHYNAVCNPVEVLVDGDDYRVIRRREQYSDLVRAEEGL